MRCMQDSPRIITPTHITYEGKQYKKPPRTFDTQDHNTKSYYHVRDLLHLLAFQQ